MKRIQLGQESGAYSAAVIAAGTFAFISGQGPLRNGAPVRGSIEEETTVTLNNLLDVVKAAGGSKESIVRCSCYLASIEDFPRFNEAYRSFFGSNFPARTTVGAELFDGIKVEIDAIVCLS
jgi:2-iminobutanoate/2-iminopropanoate deaminase